MKTAIRTLLAALSAGALIWVVPTAAAGAALPDGLQKITVVASSYSTSYAHLSAWQTEGGQWVRVLGPWTARVGYNGIAPMGTETEDSGKTPAGTFGLGFMFGVKPRPDGITWPGYWHRARWYDKWDDDPASPRYNLWTNILKHDAGRNPENMRTIPQYNYGIVINYNTDRVPGAGSAIFLHVEYGGATAGCVSLPTTHLLAVLRWLNAAGNPFIRIKVA
jgi:L,D-peptidoglycan transpeptidase YkuD (ErfK/YbiS/YcfS/YnhG family)